MNDKSVKTLHIIIAINQMVDVYLPDLVERLKPDQIRIIEFYPKPIITSYSGPELERYLHPNRLGYLRDLKQCLSDIQELERGYGRINFYFAHIFSALTNHLFFSKNKKYRFHLIPDGIANYYRISTRAFFIKMVLKKIMSILTGIRYTMYPGHLTGIDTGRIKSIYTLSAQGLISGKAPVIKLDLRWKSRFEKIETPQLLILGQSYTDYRYYKSRYRQIFDYVRSNYGKQFRLFYKAHPNEKVLPGFMDMLRDFNIDLIAMDRPVEYLAGTYQIIVSEFSSALSNIKIIYGDRIRCIGFIKIPERRLVNHYRRSRLIEIKEHFRHMGVEVIEQ